MQELCGRRCDTESMGSQLKAVRFILSADELPNEWPLYTVDTLALARDTTIYIVLCIQLGPYIYISSTLLR